MRTFVSFWDDSYPPSRHLARDYILTPETDKPENENLLPLEYLLDFKYRLWGTKPCIFGKNEVVSVQIFKCQRMTLVDENMRIFTRIHVTLLEVNCDKYIRISFSNKIAYDYKFRKIFENCPQQTYSLIICLKSGNIKILYNNKNLTGILNFLN